MPDFLLSIEYNLETTLLAMLASSVFMASLVWLTMSAVCRSRSTQLQSALEQQTAITQQQRSQLESERTQLESDLVNSKQQQQQVELKLAEQSSQITQLEKDKQAIQAEAERALALESYICQRNQQLADLDSQLEQALQLTTTTPTNTDSSQGELLWQRHQQVISQLQQRLLANTEIQAQLEQLQQAQQTWQRSVAEKEAALTALNNKVEQQSAQISQLEQNLLQQQAELIEEQQAKAEQQQLLHQEQQAKAQSLQQLDQLTTQLQQLEQELANKPIITATVANTQAVDSLAQQELEQNYQVLVQKLADSEATIKQLQTELTQAQPKLKPDSDWERKFAEQEAVIAKLNTNLAEQAHYLARLEYDLEVKKLLIKDQKYPLQGIPASIIARQEADQARIDELETRLNPHKKVTKKVAEKTTQKPAELLNPAKERIENISEKAKHFPTQLKGFYRKILPKKGEK